MKQNADFQVGISQAQSTATLLYIPVFLTTNESFQIRYYIRIFLKEHENCHGVKVESLKQCHLAILMPLEENPLQCLILKLSLVVKNFGVGRGVAEL